MLEQIQANLWLPLKSRSSLQKPYQSHTWINKTASLNMLRLGPNALTWSSPVEDHHLRTITVNNQNINCCIQFHMHKRTIYVQEWRIHLGCIFSNLIHWVSYQTMTIADLAMMRTWTWNLRFAVSMMD